MYYPVSLNVAEEPCFTYQQLRGLLEGPTGDQAMRYAFRRYAQGQTARYPFRGQEVVLEGPEAVSYFAISDFLDLCFAQPIPDVDID